MLNLHGQKALPDSLLSLELNRLRILSSKFWYFQLKHKSNQNLYVPTIVYLNRIKCDYNNKHTSVQN